MCLTRKRNVTEGERMTVLFLRLTIWALEHMTKALP